MVGAQAGNDAFQPVVPTGRAVGPDAQMSRLLGDVIAQHNDVVCRDLVKVGGGGNALSAQVHVGQRLEQHDLVAVHLCRAVQALPFGFGNVALPLRGQIVQRLKTGVVAGAVIFRFGVAQSGNQPVRPGGHFEHRYIL